ncbi:MAG: peroxidase-related enzyme [Thermoplasmata archaeon]
MRLDNLEHGHGLKQRVLLRVIRLASGGEESGLDLVKMMLYRAGYFGRSFSHLMQEVMRGPSDWSVGERELLAAFTSKVNQTPFCAAFHGAAASLALEDDGTEAILADWRSAPLDDRMRAVFAFIEKLAHAPEDLQGRDIDALRASGLTLAQIEEAVHISAGFHIINRLADAFGFQLPSPRGVVKGARGLLRYGYAM